MVAPFPDEPTAIVASRDGTPIAVFSAGSGPPLLLIHGTTSDHRTWRVIAPMLVPRRRLHAMDRRGRGCSGDAPAYTIERELDDVAVVAETIAAASGDSIDVVGHSLGGRVALAASLRTSALRRIVAYESAPDDGIDATEADARLLSALREDLASGDLDGMLARFMTEGVGMPETDLEAFRANPIWPRRAAAAPTILRELAAARHAPEMSRTALAGVTVPVLQLVGSESVPTFRHGAEALDRLLANGRLEVIVGARHAAHHSHPDAFVATAEAFLDR